MLALASRRRREDDPAPRVGSISYMDQLTITAEHDEDARVWVAVEDSIGLATEAESLEVLGYKLREMLPELVELNRGKATGPLRFTLVSRRDLEAYA